MNKQKVCKIFAAVAVLCALLVLAVIPVAAATVLPPHFVNHKHEYEDWTNDEANHTKKCKTCPHTVSMPHDFSDWASVEGGNYARTCGTCGTTETCTHDWPTDWSDNGDNHIKVCPTCSAEQTGSHSYGQWSKIDADTHGRTCSGCGKIETAGHEYGEWANDGDEHKKTCADCGDVISEAHDFATEYSSNATHHYYKCSAQGCTATDGRGEHTGGEASCSEQAVCTECSASYGDLPGHDYGSWSTYGEEGHQRVCNNCGMDWEYASHAWDDGVVQTPATETTTGTKVYTCYVCNDTKTAEIPTTSHTHTYGDEWKKNDTQHWHECTCGDKNDAADHTWSEEVTTPVTCEKKGVKTLTCTACKATKTEEIPLAEHTWDNGVETTKATETSVGVMTYTCTACMATKIEEISMLEHTHQVGEDWNKDDAQHWHVCDGCDERVDVADHTWNEGEVTVEATEQTAGNKTYTCTVCGETREESIPQLEPSDTPDDPATPSNPDDPDTPENPDDPNNPNNPDDPGTPDTPKDPEGPKDPEDPEKKELPKTIIFAAIGVVSIGAVAGVFISFARKNDRYR